MLVFFVVNHLPPNYEFRLKLLAFLSISIFVCRMEQFQLLPCPTRSMGAGECRHPCGALVLLCIKLFFLAHRHFLFRPRVFSSALGSVAHREPARTPWRKFGPWPRSAARALGVQSRENWQVTTGGHSEHVEPSRPMQTRVKVLKNVRRVAHVVQNSADGSH